MTFLVPMRQRENAVWACLRPFSTTLARENWNKYLNIVTLIQ